MFVPSRANCIVCMLRPVIYAGLFGTTPTELSCRHSKRQSEFPSAKYSRFWGSLCVFVTLAEVTGLILHIIKHVYYKEKFDFVKDVYWYITYSRVIHIMFHGIFMSPSRVKEFNGLISILEDRKYFGIQTFIDTPTVLYYRKVSTVTQTIIILVQIIYFVTSLLNNSTLYDIIEDLTAILCFTVHGVTGSYFILIGFVYTHLYNVCFLRIKRCLSAGIINRKSVQVVNLHNEKLWMEQLIKLIRLYSCLQKNFVLRKRYSGATVVMSFNMFTIMFVFNFFLLTLRLLYKIQMSFLATVLQFETVCSLFVLTVFSMVYDNLANLSEEITSFLFRYPISKLSQAEAAQVEMMITTLHVQKPILKASDIFTVGTGLLASISGTVVTYVLVALQFHASWAKE